tara:strand:+ start:123 stop:356 length:234 start_codon:yes stop_codon:yes gene_type:complete
MKMNKEEYEKLLKRFALELSEVGVTDDMIKIVDARIERAPNASSACSEENTDQFTYRHNGYTIEAQRTVKLVVKKCK